MESPLLQAIPSPRRKVVVGTHETSCGRKSGEARLTVVRVANGEAQVHFGPGGNPYEQWLNPAALREFAKLFTEMADALDWQDSK